MEGIDFWRLCDFLSVKQAALLIAGHDPSQYDNSLEWADAKKQPKGYKAAKTAIFGAMKNNLIKGEIYTATDRDGEEYSCPHQSTVTVDGIKTLLRVKGLDNHFFFFPDGQSGEFLDEENPRYSPKLAAAIRAWKALESEDMLKNSTPKKAAQKWLRLHAVEFNLCDSDGKPTESAIEEIAKVVNWNQKGGAPATSTGQLDIPESKKKRKFAVEKLETPTDWQSEIDIDLDSIPF